MVDTTKVIWRPRDRANIDNPYPHFKKCRKFNPVQQTRSGSWVLFRYGDIEKVLQSKESMVTELAQNFAEKESFIFKHSSQCPYLQSSTSLWPMYRNGLVHSQLRQAIKIVLANVDIQGLMITSIARTLDQFGHMERIDLPYLSRHIFGYMIKQLFGLPKNITVEQIDAFCHELANLADPFATRHTYLKANEWLLWGNRVFESASTKDSHIKHRLNSVVDRLSDESNSYSLWAVLLVALYETSKNNLTFTLLEMLNDPQLIEVALEANDQNLQLLAQEFLRFNSPAQYVMRKNSKTLVFDNKEITEGSRIYLCLASANRDESTFSNAEQIIPYRTPNPHLAFGSGLHFCLGAGLAVKEAKIYLPVMARFISRYRLSPDHKIEFSKNIMLRTVEHAIIQKR